MKITLHDSIPPARRPEVEAIVKIHLGDCRITWAPSRFPRLVILVEPSGSVSSASERGSFFESPNTEEESIAAMTEALEAKIKTCLAI